MAEILSLSKARKAKAKVTKETTAGENRAKFGLTKFEKQQQATTAAKAKSELDGHKRDI